METKLRGAVAITMSNNNFSFLGSLGNLLDFKVRRLNYNKTKVKKSERLIKAFQKFNYFLVKRTAGGEVAFFSLPKSVQDQDRKLCASREKERS